MKRRLLPGQQSLDLDEKQFKTVKCPVCWKPLPPHKLDNHFLKHEVLLDEETGYEAPELYFSRKKRPR